jgi:hypothetical protein
MNERQYSYLALIFAFMALFIFLTPFILPFLSRLFEIGFISQSFFITALKFCAIFGWILGLAISIVSFKMAYRIKEGFLRFTIRKISFLTIALSTCLGILEVALILLNIFMP